MNNLVIPPSANWYETLILACAPDNTLIYGSRNDIVIIYDSPNDQPSDVRIIPRAHSQKIVSTNINRNWGQPHKLLVTVAEDNIIKLWDIETRKKKIGHNAHAGHDKVIGATFAGDDKVISVSEGGTIIVWNLTLNQTKVLKDIFGSKVTITCISTCPHANWLTAFGLKNGLVIVTDLRKQGKILYKLRGHDKSIMSLAWCPAPVNIFPKNPHNYVGVKSINSNDIEGSPDKNRTVPPKSSPDKISVTTPKEFAKPENEHAKFDAVVKNKTDRNIIKNNIWSNLKHADDDELHASGEQENDPHLPKDDTGGDDFLKECLNLKNLIRGQVKPEITEETGEVEKDRVVIKAKRKQQKNLEEDTEASTSTNKTEEISNIVSLSAEEDVKLRVDEVGTPSTELQLKEKISSLSLDKNNTEEPPDECIKETFFDNKQPSAAEGDPEANEESKSDNKTDDVTLEQTNNTICGGTNREIPPNVPEREEPRREFLLASSGKEGNIYVWRAGTDGRMQTFFNAPNKTGHRRSNKSNSDKVWIVLCWISPTILLSSSKSAELVKWILPKPKDKNKQFSTIHYDHNSILFSIAAPILLLNEYNWLDERKLNVWTAGHDRLLLNTSLTNERKNLACYPTLGNAECFALSPVDPNRLAIGTAEGVIKVWDLSRPNIKNIVMTSFFQKIQSKVVTLAWHPTDELVLAYGTLEGRVGFIDTSNRSKTPTVPQHFFKLQVHKIEWGPINGNKEDLGLFAVAEGKLVLYSAKKSEKAPVEVDTPDDTFVYTFAWKPDYSMLLVGSKSGSIILYSADLKILSTHYFQHRLNDIYWHPDASQSSLDISKYCYWFAAVSNSKNVIVCDFQEDIEDGQKIVAKYERSEDVINFIAWNPYTSNQLVIASDEGTAQVWDVETDSIISTYTSPNFEGFLSTIWSPVDSDCIISAIKDHTIRVWRISDCPPQEDIEVKELKKRIIKEITKEQMDLLPKAEKPHEEVPKSKTTKTNLLPNFFYPKDAPKIIEDLRKLFLWKEGSCDVETEGGDSNTCDILKIFGSKNDMLNIIEQNEAVLREKGKFSLSNTLSLFKGDINAKIKKAVEEKRITPWIIMMAPMVSPKLWQSACEVYAQQLSETADSDPIEIATFYLACHKVEEAIDALCEGTMFREALALTKCRLPEDSPTITKIMEKWAKYSVAVGNFEAAAQCYIYLGKYEDAASVLFRRTDIGTLKLAVELAEKSGNEELYKAVLFRYNAYENENITKETEKELPSKLDMVLQQFLENEDKNKEENLEKVGNGCENGVAVDNESEGMVSLALENGKLEEHVKEKNILYENVKEKSLQEAVNISVESDGSSTDIIQ